jgi:hypothetical protein
MQRSLGNATNFGLFGNDLVPFLFAIFLTSKESEATIMKSFFIIADTIVIENLVFKSLKQQIIICFSIVSSPALIQKRLDKEWYTLKYNFSIQVQ